ncbi:hypothetical protein DUI87_10382 [Hirundo rustica rustica]|uniref:Uncharacterized protein n=1 Tax=Hirundo rustica rustica TaxID=333673 RepID=A0A3M0L0D0_HIRRU|nr:hypothetical protein DUI87_10382 [Hirundo rustica rustica]
MIWMPQLNALLAGLLIVLNWEVLMTLKGGEVLQRDLDRLEYWAMIHGMKFNKDSAPGTEEQGPSRNIRYKYKLGEESLENSCAERDLGVGSSSVWVGRVCPNQEGKLCSGVQQTQHHQPHLEHCEQFWGPQFKEDVKVLDCIQKRATNLVEGMEGMSCEEWRRTLGLSSSEKKRLNFDLVALCGCLRRGHGEGGADLFSLESSDRTHGNGSKMQ